jgi:HSP20 family protein
LKSERPAPTVSLFDDFFNDVFARNGALAARNEAAAPMTPVLRARMDVLDKGENYEVKVDLPGVKKDDIQVTIEGPRVAISAESKSESETKDRQGRVLHSERYAARYARSFELPVEVNESGAAARFEDGVLTLALPKKAAVVSKRLAIN